MPRSTSSLRAVATAAALSLALPGAASAANDPFAPHLRWRHVPPAGAATLPSAVDFAAGGELVGSAASLGGARWMLSPSAPNASTADLAPEREVVDAAAIGALGIVGDPSGTSFFAVVQHALSSPSDRRTEVVRYDANAGAAQGSAWTEGWRHAFALTGNGAAKLGCARNGARVVAATHDSATSTLELRWIDAASGALLAGAVRSSSTLRALSISSDGTRAAVVAGAELTLFAGDGSVVYAVPLATATNALALSGDGRTLAVGSGSRLVLLRETAGTFSAYDDLMGGIGELPVRAALSDDGATLAVAWWSQANGTTVRFQLAHAGAIVAEEHFSGSPYGFQNYPEAVCVTPDGRRAAFGAWGTMTTEPEVVVVDRDSGARVMAVDLPGSVRSLALDSGGTRVAVALKHGHANQFGSSGEVRLYDTGERDLQLLATPRAGATLEFAARAAGASRAFFLIGPRLASPVPFAGASGLLAIDRSAARLYVRPADPSGRADLSAGLPLGAAGTEFAAQAALRVAGTLVFTSSVVEPVVF